jgi:hypothetical protein
MCVKKWEGNKEREREKGRNRRNRNKKFKNKPNWLFSFVGNNIILSGQRGISDVISIILFLLSYKNSSLLA